MKKIIYLSISLLLFSCSTTEKIVKTELKDNRTFLLTEIATDPTYGLSNKNPVEVGGVDKEIGPLNERRFLNSLAGPNGEAVSYYRAGSCCPVNSKNGYMGKAMLDNYRVTWEGSKDTISIFINMYDYGELKAPVGFTIKRY
ncbi:2-dehydro-3-deoxyphosphooctonate aldolase [Pontibacter arcticus]|uniref:2-dehydro-3-deoxyphosphooctonate aldolase n=1 Tax=Pontibacter arcticus TaxID=2080288 RepID=A0A364RIB3_9BACT|nr:2-dehydro-3-deoxyphosphooctonate aldolase [Pontibacter arcticus]RAU84042.1 2-dehydro-3-deoxyphosphooctonate aldolase [Pontibacter arcticus]